ncbi:hypothetical protein [Lysobacter silvisoli]|uniref:GIY-YIG nuclease family protein n=1 Tax=Lysobacter silvisoli TaxID=2293254 RepID=A0A371K1P8_9GAMM|nr:hypothetical protein [Lysobacter silvisoli]RDZ27859.1 hypothetical protein DX914_01435 [Lysobacter silvisoli]
MAAAVSVALNWTCVEWHPEDTWTRDLLPRLVEAGAYAPYLARAVYVIRLAGNFAISYPKGDTPAVYVGEGSFGSRIQSHKRWASQLEELVGEFQFEVCVATPRVRNCPTTYLDCEAVVLQRFRDRFGSAPLWNKQIERRRHPHHEYSQRKLDYAISKRSGARYHWALKPLPSSPFYASYQRTHV